MSLPPPPMMRDTQPPIGAVDCSDAAQAVRWQRLQDLEARAFGGIQSVSDRNRQVSFMSAKDIAVAIQALRAQIRYCQTGDSSLRQVRVAYPPQVKNL